MRSDLDHRRRRRQREHLVGPGGGGAGGFAFIRNGASPACAIESLAGSPGRESDLLRGAGPPPEQRDAEPYVGVVSTDLAP